MGVRAVVVRLLSCALVALWVMVFPAPQAGADGGEHTPVPALGAGEPFVHMPVPAPGALVEAGATELRARLWSSAPVERVDVTLDGAAVTGVVLTGAPDGETEVSAQMHLAPGPRSVTVAFSDGAGLRAERTWLFTATARSNQRVAGGDRIATAVALSTATFPPGGAGAAVIARADDFADALAGVPLAADSEGPLLLSWRDELPAATAAELRRVLAPGSIVHLLGGGAALSDSVRRAVEQLGFEVARHGGADRFATAATVAGLLPPSSDVLLASGVAFPDALSASAPAGRDGLPVLLTAADRLPDATARALAERSPAVVTIVGGTAAVGAAVEGRVGDLAGRVRRIAGLDRYATAVAVLDAFYERPAAVSLASGVAFPDALAGARHAAALGQPLLLTHPDDLSAATDGALALHRPERLDVYGGHAAVREAVARAALLAAENGRDAPRVTATRPGAAATVRELRDVVVEFDRAVVAASSAVHVAVGGTELRGRVEQGSASTLVFRAEGDQAPPAPDVRHPVHVTVRAADGQGRVTHHETAFSYLRPDPVFATAGPVALHLPSRHVELIGFHEANHPGAQQQTPRDTATPQITLPSRRRGTGSRTAADVVADPAHAVLAPVTGRVVRAGTYLLYCRNRDNFVVIEPDARPGWEVKVLHFHGLRVGVGDRVVADDTVIGAGPRQLPLRSQVDAYTHPRDWPHLHVEVVDPSVPTRPGSGC